MRPIPGVTYKLIQKPVPDLNKQWQVVLLIIMLPFDTSVLFFLIILHYKFVSTKHTICVAQGWKFDL